MKFNGGQVPVDTAFVIFNTDTYPIFSKLLDHLGVASRRAPTSFSCNIDGRGVDFVYGRAAIPSPAARLVQTRAVPHDHRGAPVLPPSVIADGRRRRRRGSDHRGLSRARGYAGSSSTTSSSLRPQRSGPCPSPPAASSMPGRSLRDSAKRSFSPSAIAMNGGPSRAEARSTSGSSCPPCTADSVFGTDVCSITRMANAVRVRDASGEESLFDHVDHGGSRRPEPPDVERRVRSGASDPRWFHLLPECRRAASRPRVDAQPPDPLGRLELLHERRGRRESARSHIRTG